METLEKWLIDVSAADLGADVALPPELASDVFTVSPALDFPASDLSACGFLELLAAFSFVFASLILVSLRSANYRFVLYQFFADIHKMPADKFDVRLRADQGSPGAAQPRLIQIIATEAEDALSADVAHCTQEPAHERHPCSAQKI